MHVISRKALREFCEENKDATAPLDIWFGIANKAEWHNLAEVKKDFPHADLVSRCVVFNVGGNKFRLITKIEFKFQQIYIKSILTHEEYDLDAWKKDCYKR